MTSDLRQAFYDQSQSCTDLGSPFMGQMLTLLGDRLQPNCALTQRLFDWQGDVGGHGHSLPLRLAGALHALVLQGDPLGAVYPPTTVDDDKLWNAVSDAMIRQAGFIDRFIDSPPQTNEVRRSANLIAVGHWLTARYGLPIRLIELGASAGLNLHWDRFTLTAGGQQFGPDSDVRLTPDWTGPLPPQAKPQIVSRTGIDLSPLNPADPAHQLRLLAYLWPDQPHRLELTRAAIALADTRPVQSDAVVWLRDNLIAPSGHLTLVYSTVAWQYLPADAQAEGAAIIANVGATAAGPLAWFRMEGDGKSPGAGLSLNLWPEGITLDMGRSDYHGRWVNWSEN